MRDSGHVVVCKKRPFNAILGQEETLALSGTQRHLGEHCVQISCRKIACAVVFPSQPARQLALATYSRDGVICGYGQELASYQMQES